jgi:hypothetical protein
MFLLFSALLPGLRMLQLRARPDANVNIRIGSRILRKLKGFPVPPAMVVIDPAIASFTWQLWLSSPSLDFGGLRYPCPLPRRNPRLAFRLVRLSRAHLALPSCPLTQGWFK